MANYPTDMLVCYAGLSDTFTFSNVDAPNSTSAVSIVLDAHTGNEPVMIGGPLLR